MSEQTDLHLAMSRALHTEDLGLEHDTIVASPELTSQVTQALGAVAQMPVSGHTPMADLARAARA